MSSNIACMHEVHRHILQPCSKDTIQRSADRSPSSLPPPLSLSLPQLPLPGLVSRLHALKGASYKQVRGAGGGQVGGR